MNSYEAATASHLILVCTYPAGTQQQGGSIFEALLLRWLCGLAAMPTLYTCSTMARPQRAAIASHLAWRRAGMLFLLVNTWWSLHSGLLPFWTLLTCGEVDRIQ